MARFLWTQKQDIGPSPRAHSGIAYDSVRLLTYLFGGAGTPGGAFTAYEDSWSWDGRYWTQVTRFGPPARHGHTMTFDAARGNTVVFGGQTTSGGYLRDTWVFDGFEWTQVEDIGPSPRARHAAAYDATRQCVVLFGGLERTDGPETFVEDTWEWDGESWTQVEANGPGPRKDHVMAFDQIRNRTVLFGGSVTDAGGAPRLLNDTWEWSGDAWTLVSDIGPGPRNLAAMTSAGGAVILHGGAFAGFSRDTWQWIGADWSKVQEIGPSPRGAHALAYDSDRQKIVLFGGESNDPGAEFLGDTWEAPGDSKAANPGPENLIVTPAAISLSAGLNPAIQFNIASSLTTTTFLIELVDAAGRRQPVGNGSIPPMVTQYAQALRWPWLVSAVSTLGLSLPANVWLTTDLGSATVALQLNA